MEARDLYLRITDSNGKSYVTQHRVWDAVRFFEAMTAAHAKEQRAVAYATEADYRTSNWKKR